MNLLIKLVSIPLLIWLVDVFTPLVDYVTLLPYLATGIMIGGLGWTADELILPRIGNIPSLVIDGLVAFTVLAASPAMFPGSYVSWGGVGLMTLLITVVEFILHRWVVLSPYTEIVEE